MGSSFNFPEKDDPSDALASVHVENAGLALPAMP